MKRIKVKKYITWLVILGALFIGAKYYFIKTKAEPVINEVSTSVAQIGTIETFISGRGTLNPADQYEIKSLVKGEILEAAFEEGDQVEKGETLYQISTKEITNTIKASELGVAKAKLVYEEYLEKKKQLILCSRFQGFIKSLYVEAGDRIQAGEKIAEIYDNKVMYLDLLFPLQDVNKSWVNKQAEVFMASTGESIQGTVTKVSSMVEEVTGGILAKRVTISIENQGGISEGDIGEAAVDDVYCSSSGVFRPATNKTIIAENSGIIEHLSVSEGSWVDQGEQLLNLSSKELDKQMKEGELAIVEAELSLENQKEQRNLYTIEAPISGEVIMKKRKQGDILDPSTNTQAGAMAVIYDLTYLTVSFNVDELQIKNIKEGQRVVISCEAIPEESFEGVVERISLCGVTNLGVTTYPVTVRLDNYGGLIPGMNITGKIYLEKAENVLMVPSASLQRGDILYVKAEVDVQSEDTAKDENNLVPEGFVPVMVETGLNDGANVEIKSGLKEGDVVFVPFEERVESTIEFEE